MDESGRTLMFDRFKRSDGGTKCYYWGQPTKAEIVVVQRLLEKTIPFEILRGDVDKDAYAAFKKETLSSE
jgi:hypothetical protein